MQNTHGSKGWTTAVLASLTVATMAGAQTNEVTHRLGDLVVRPERNVLMEPTRESAALEIATTQIDADTLKNLRPATASDALEAAPGIHTETRGRKYKTFHSFRGQIYPYPSLLLDGLWQREALELLYVYPGAALERIEIMRSSATLFSGLSDVTGVINLVPRAPRSADAPGPDLEWGAEAGSYGTLRAYVLGRLTPDTQRALNIGGQYYRTDGRSGRNAAEEISSVFGTLLLRSDADHRITVGGWLLHGFRELEMPDPDGPAGTGLKNRRERFDPLTYSHINLRGFHRHSEQSSSDWKVFYSDRRSRYINRKIKADGPGPGPADEKEDDHEYGAQWIQSMALQPANTLRMSLFAHRWTAPNGKQSYVGSKQDVSSLALALADEHKLGSWTLDAGLRYAQSYFHDFSGPAFDIAGRSTQLQTVRDEWDKSVVSGTLGAALALDDARRLFVHGGTSTRRPGPGAVRPDGSTPDAEQRFSADLGWESLWGPRQSGRLTLTGFGLWRQDAIARINQTGIDAVGNEFYFSANQDIRQQGLEAELRTPSFWRDRLSLSGGLTWMRSDVKTDGAYEKYREIPSLVFSGSAQARIGRWDGTLLTKYADAYENFRFAQDNLYHDLGDYWDLALIGGVRFGDQNRIRLYGAIDNLLDEEYSTVVGWSDPGRRFRAGIEAAF